MGIRIMGMPDTSHLCRVAAVRYKEDLVTGRTPAEADFYSSKAFLGFYGPERCNKPYLCLIGAVTSIRGSFPQNITEVTLDEPVPVAFVYDFSSDELADMCRKGLFTPGFKCPDIFENQEWNGLPIPYCSFSMIPGDTQSAPVIFVGVERAFDLPLDKNCGYEAGSYFEPAVEKQVEFQDDDYTERRHPEAETGHEPDYEDEAGPAPYLDAKAAAKSLANVESLDGMSNSVIMSNPQLRAAYESMQASVKAKLGVQAAQQTVEPEAGDTDDKKSGKPVDFRARAAAEENLDNYQIEDKPADKGEPSAPAPRPEMRDIFSSGPDDGKELE